MDRELFRRLGTPEGRDLLERAAQAYAERAADPVGASARLRRDHAPDLVAAALTQARLRRAAAVKFGPDAGVMLFTAEGLEQATAREVAEHRAGRLAARVGPGAAVLDLGCGLGGDLIALARAGLAAVGVERDPLTAELARANLAALGLADPAEPAEPADPYDPVDPADPYDPTSGTGVAAAVTPGRAPAPGTARVLSADATEVDRTGFAAVIADPARRDRKGRVFDPDAYSPPWWFVQRLLADRTTVTCVKTAPIIEHDRIEQGVVAEWVSLDGEVKEAALWSGLDTGHPEHRGQHGQPGQPGQHGRRREATVLRSGQPAATLTDADDPGEAEVRELTVGPEPPTGRGGPSFLYEPDGAVIRAGLVTAVAPLVAGGLVHPRIAYLVSDTLTRTPFARGYRIEEILPYGGNQQKRLRRRLAELGVGRLTVKKRGLEVDPDQVRRKLAGTGPNAATLILTRTPGGAIALITQPIQQDG